MYYKIIFKSKQHKHCVKSCAGKKRKIFSTWKKVEQLYNKQNKVYDEKKKKHNLMHTYVRCEKNKKHFSSILFFVFCFLHKLNNNYILLSIFFLITLTRCYYYFCYRNDEEKAEVIFLGGFTMRMLYDYWWCEKRTLNSYSMSYEKHLNRRELNFICKFALYRERNYSAILHTKKIIKCLTTLYTNAYRYVKYNEK